MIPSPQPSPYRPETTILSLGDGFYDAVRAAIFPDTRIRFRNDAWAAAVGLGGVDDDAWARHFGRFDPLPGNLTEPLAMRYHGHQFRSYNSDLGDGRGFLFAQLRDGAGRLLDLGTKGSGQTPYSRFADGRLTLKGGVREVLATEMLEALGVDTSRTFSLIETGEQLYRGDEPSPARSAVLVRLSHGHIRIGSFQRLAWSKDDAGLERLVAYCLANFFGEAPGDVPAAQLLGHVVACTARLAAGYMAAGFVHGVLNTDNINVTGESFDYGPWRFTPRWQPGFTAAYFDRDGLYAFGRQAEAIHWNLVQLASSLRSIAPTAQLTAAIDSFAAAYEEAFADAMFRRLGIARRSEEEDLALLQSLEVALNRTDVEIDRFFFDWRGGSRRAASPADAIYDAPAFADFTAQVAGFAPAAPLAHPYWSDRDPCSMHIGEVEAIWAAIAGEDDWRPFDAKIAAVRRMGDAHRGDAKPSATT
ncbi:MAG: hypothetical protein JWL91_2605 [Sphingomonas bacterium]|nr:YdiU family protein [Sphingomonas bacterium]MDB5690729.1 hypothetical protein [Sphingomonas bacterium]